MLVDKLGCRREGFRNPLFDVMFNFLTMVDFNTENNLQRTSIMAAKPWLGRGKLNEDFAGRVPGTEEKIITRRAQENIFKNAHFDISLHGMERNNVLVFWLNYRTSLFRHNTMKQLINHLINILERVVKNSGIPLGEIDILSEGEREHIFSGIKSKLYGGYDYEFE
jgi:non-ribosomal peptide synthetase component F